MTRTPFDTPSDALPHTLPVFPLTGVLLLPRGRLPLNIFEPRYLAMVEDALKTDRLIGMIQPTENGGRAPSPPMYPVGCAGRITQFAETDDGRYLITLTGVARFAVTEELTLGRGGYRRVVAEWDRFRRDCEGEDEGTLDRPRLLNGLKAYFKLQEISANWDAIDATPDEKLVTSLSMICPFAPNEKQALLEAEDLTRRGEALIALIEMAILSGSDADGAGARH